MPARATQRRFATGPGGVVLAAALAAGAALAQESLSLDAALQIAHASNARLPVPSAEIAIARARRSEAAASRWLQVAVEGNFLYAPQSSRGIGYDPALSNLGEARLVAAARQPLYAGGGLAADAARADAAVEAAAARYRVAEKDLDLDVRGRYFELLAAEDEERGRREGIDRLETYLRSLRERQASGQAVASDVMKTEVRLALEQTAILEASQRAEDARIQLNALLGRPAGAPLAILPLAPPAPAEPVGGGSWQATPEVAEAEALTRGSEAEVRLARAERLPKVNLSADFGLWESDTQHLNADFWDRLWRGRGYSLGVTFTWSVWDRGVLRARQAAADLALAQSRLRVEAEKRGAEMQWSQARAAMRHLRQEIDSLSRAAPMARDAYLAAESRYRGGAATALDVLDSYAAAVDAAVKLSDATARYRLAEALARRWGTP